MHDIKFIRENFGAFDAGLVRRGVEAQSTTILKLDADSRSEDTRQQEVLARRNKRSDEIKQAMIAGDQQLADQLKHDASIAKDVEASIVAVGRKKASSLRDLLSSLPNLPDADVPDGADETGNKEILRWPNPDKTIAPPIATFVREHADLGPALGLDFETGALISGSRFTFLRGQMARLQRALGQFMLDQQTLTNGYTECAPPLLVRSESAFGTGQLPKFKKDLFSTTVPLDHDEMFAMIDRSIDQHWDVPISEERKAKIRQEIFLEFSHDDENRLWLIPTAEVSLTNSVREQILAETALPIRMTALTPCFRSEAGAAGKDTRGYIRQHQFEKVELVSICRPEDSAAEHERMTAAAESILQALELPYRKMLLCAGDMGFTARKTYDLEVWLPGQAAYREISSCSNCGDFQARRMNTQYKPEGQSKGPWPFVHTLNGSGLAVGRTLVAVLENYQQEDGSVTVPAALLPYMGGITALVPA